MGAQWPSECRWACDALLNWLLEVMLGDFRGQVLKAQVASTLSSGTLALSAECCEDPKPHGGTTQTCSDQQAQPSSAFVSPQVKYQPRGLLEDSSPSQLRSWQDESETSQLCSSLSKFLDHKTHDQNKNGCSTSGHEVLECFALCSERQLKGLGRDFSRWTFLRRRCRRVSGWVIHP